MIHNYCAKYGEVLLRPLHRYDIEYLREWRNDPDTSKFLSRMSPINRKMQEQWYKNYIDNQDVFFVIDYKRIRSVGTIALYEFGEDDCSIGKVVIGEKNLRGKGLAYYSFIMAMCIGIWELKINKFKLSVHEKNFVALKLYRKLGFKKVGEHIFCDSEYEYDMEISTREFMSSNIYIKDITLFKENEVSTETFKIT